MVKVRKSLVGMKFERLKVVEQIDDHKMPSGKQSKYLCKCDCGNEKKIQGRSLKSGNTRSCGCLNTETITKHGLGNHQLYGVWNSMIQRCINPKATGYIHWGGRGIVVCEEWIGSFIRFYEWSLANGYKDGLDIDRINNDGNYEATNCRFVTRQENNLNKRIQSNNTSGYTGVFYIENHGKWLSYVDNQKRYRLGRYTTKKEALQVRNEFIIKMRFKHKIQEWRE